jgi:G3E family GTPase
MDRLPLHVLTGFLGSGKTTLLNRLVRDPELSDSALLINEIGAASIDHHLVDRMESGDDVDMVVLQGGCTCCTVRGDLVAALRELYQRRAEGRVPPFRRVVLETTGLADPAPILFTLVGDPVLRHKFEAGAVVATVDAVHGFSQLERFVESRKQAAVADRLVLAKTDLAEPPAIARTIDALRRLNPAAEIVDANAPGALAALLAGPAQAVQGWMAAPQAQMHASHTSDVRSIAFALEGAVEWSPFAVWLSLLLHAHGDNVLRVKALLNVANWPNPVALHGIHHLIHPPAHLSDWPAGPCRSYLVFIVKDLDVARIEASLRAFLDAHALERGGLVAEPIKVVA